MNQKPVFTSLLGNLLEQYVEHMKMRGYKFDTGEYEARQLDAFAADSSITSGALTKDLVEAYIALRPGEKQSTQSHRISTVRCFGKYLIRCGFDAYVLPYGVHSVAKYGFVPHIFSAEDAARFMSAADSLPHLANAPKRHIVMPMMFRLIYGCGLRISEAINLQIDNVDIETGVIFIRAAKFNKDRYVPMAFSLLEKCQIYASEALTGSDPKSPFLPNPSGRFYGRSTIGHAFHQCLAIAGIPHYDDGPTVHSLRHSFACQCLVRWGREGKDINAMLPYLSAYMGHENLLGTERYLRITKEMFPEVRALISAGCSWLMPEVAHNEN
jgi:integrase